MLCFPSKLHKRVTHPVTNAYDCYNNSFLSFLFPTVKKDLEETDNRMTQFKKKAKELRILDAKTAQNLCKFLLLFVIVSVVT